MSHYPSILTPPSSNEDSPQPLYFNPSPSSSYPSPESSSTQGIVLNFDLNISKPEPFLKILEQPIEKFRFRYKSEMTGTHGSLCGQKSDKSRKMTFPKIKLYNFNQPAVVRCSIYQYNAQSDNMPHAHRLVKKQGKDEVDDPHDEVISNENDYECSFHSMGIIHTAKKNLVSELVRKKTKLKEEEIARTEKTKRRLNTKEELEIKGLAEAESKSINLNVVVLRFDAFYVCNGILHPICDPVYSHGINNLKSALTGELKIVRMDHCSSPAKGGREVFILVERVTKKNIKIRFYELDDEDCVVWEDYGKFSDLDVHHQYAIVFKTPPYKNPNITTPVKVFIQLERPTDKAQSEPKEFKYVPSNDTFRPGAKRTRPNYSSSYDSSFPSSELPLTIHNLGNNSPTVNSLLDGVDCEVNSAELHEALNNIDSEEFDRMFKNWGPQFHSIETDAPLMKAQYRLPNVPSALLPGNRGLVKIRNKTVSSRPVSKEEEKLAKSTMEEMRSFMKTKPTDSKVVAMLRHHLSQDNKTNVLHVAVKQSDGPVILFLLKLCYLWKQQNLFNVKNDDGLTPLHLAVYGNNQELVKNFVDCQASLCVGDSEGNTALHIAVLNNAPTEMMEALLSKADNFVDQENNDGNTALNLAIEGNNLRIVKILCMKKANINKKHKKDGYTPLRFAIERQNVDVVKYILAHPQVEPLIEDFQGKTPFLAASKNENEELLAVITEYMTDHGYCEVEVKNEIDEYSDEEMEEKFSVKLEQISPEDLRDMYSNVADLTPQCLEEIADILDSSGNVENLAELLDIGHLLRSGLYDRETSPTKRLIKLAVENGDTILQIRDFLEHLDENQAVEIIDNMVKSQFV